MLFGMEQLCYSLLNASLEKKTKPKRTKKKTPNTNEDEIQCK